MTDLEIKDRAGAGALGETYVSAFGRGLAVIRCFSSDHPTLTIAEVARMTNLNRSTARRFLHTLVAEGYLRATEGRYSLRPSVLEIGLAYLSTLSIDDLYREQLRELAEEVRESCSAGVLDGTDVVFVARAQTSHPRVMTLALSVGARIPAHLTALGRVLLADLPADELDAYLEQVELRAVTERTVISPDALREVIRAVGEEGYCIVDQEIEWGVRAAAVRVRRPGKPQLAISIAAHASSSTIETFREVYLPALRRTARDIERVLQLPSGGSAVGAAGRDHSSPA